MKRYYYYIRTHGDGCHLNPAGKLVHHKGRPDITVCLLVENGGSVARGVAVCSPKDHCHKQFGKNLASLRALDALVDQASTEDFLMGRKLLKRFSTMDSVSAVILTEKMSVFNPVLSPFEYRLVNGQIKDVNSIPYTITPYIFDLPNSMPGDSVVRQGS